MSAHQYIAAIREFQQQASLVSAHCRIRRQDLASDGSSEGLRRELNADFPLEIGNCSAGIGRAGVCRWRSFLTRGKSEIQHKADERKKQFGFHGVTSETSQAPRGRVNANVVPAD